MTAAASDERRLRACYPGGSHPISLATGRCPCGERSFGQPEYECHHPEVRPDDHERNGAWVCVVCGVEFVLREQP